MVKFVGSTVDRITVPRGSRTVAEAFDPRRNNLNAIRIVLASAVIVSHAWPLTGAGTDPQFFGMNLGHWAVLGFFAISGFLITRSRMRRSRGAYYRDRVLRIMPGLAFSLVLTAGVFAPLATILNPRTSYTWRDQAGYLLRNIWLYPPRFQQFGIGTTVEHGIPFPGVWNGPLWTLFYEGSCYIGISLVVTLASRRALKPTLLVALAVAAVLQVAIVAGWVEVSGAGMIARGCQLVIPFLAGSLCWVFADRIVCDARAAVLSLVGIVVLGLTPYPSVVSPVLLAVPLLFLGTKGSLAKVGSRWDVSYGLYVFGWPVQLLVIMAAGRLGWTIPLAVDIVVVLALTLVLAFISCVAVERPALRLKQPRPAVRGSGS